MDNVRAFNTNGNIATAGSLESLGRDTMAQIAEFIELPFEYAIVTPYAGDDLMRWMQNTQSPKDRKMAASAVANKILAMWNIDEQGEFRGGCHSDLKLENILIREKDSGGFEVTIVDWEYYYDNAADQKFYGTFQYMHPWIIDLSQNKGKLISREQRKLTDVYAALMVLHAIQHGEFKNKDSLIEEMGGMGVAMSETSQGVQQGLNLVRQAAAGGEHDDQTSESMDSSGSDDAGSDNATDNATADSKDEGQGSQQERSLPYKITIKMGEQLELQRNMSVFTERLSVACEGDISSLQIDDQVTVTYSGLTMRLHKDPSNWSCRHATPAWNEPMTQLKEPPSIKEEHGRAKRDGRKEHRPERWSQIREAMEQWKANPRVSTPGVRKSNQL